MHWFLSIHDKVAWQVTWALLVGVLRAVGEVPELAGVMRCNKKIRMQQSRSSGAVHLSRYSDFCGTQYICRNVFAVVKLP